MESHGLTTFDSVGVRYDTILSCELCDNGLVPPVTRQSLGSADRTVEELLRLQPEIGGDYVAKASFAYLMIIISDSTVTNWRNLEGAHNHLNQGRKLGRRNRL